MDSGLQSGSARHAPRRKRSSIAMPCSVCDTSGWNCTPNRPRPASSITAAGEPSVEAAQKNPSGTAVTASAWLIHTVCRSGNPSNSNESPTTRNSARPYSASPVRSTSPPSIRASNWCP